MTDLDAYFERIRYDGPRAPTEAVLAAICAAHPAAIAFENIDPLLGRAPLLAPEALRNKLVARRRGGYCYEQNALLRLALLELGFEVTSLAGRVLWMTAPDAPTRARSHMLLMVELGVPGRFIVDVGFGGHLFDAPLIFQTGIEQATRHSTLRIVEIADADCDASGRAYMIQTKLAQGWAPIYRFTLDAQQPVDYEPLNWYTGTHPSSMFCHNLLAERLTADGRATLFNDLLTVRAPGQPPQVRRLETPADFGRVLNDLFDLEPPIPAEELFARVPKHVEGRYVPGRLPGAN
jgi:N-hydroxyarylamine O-acetyltransferase